MTGNWISLAKTRLSHALLPINYQSNQKINISDKKHIDKTNAKYQKAFLAFCEI
jgi:hypothetical protein